MSLAIESIAFIERPSVMQRSPFGDVMGEAGLRPSLTGHGYDVVTYPSLPSDEKQLADFTETLEGMDHIFVPFMIDRKTPVGRLLGGLLVARPSLAIPSFDYAYFRKTQQKDSVTT